MKKILLCFSILLFGTTCSVSAEANLEEGLILELLTPYVQDAIQNFYGQAREYEQEDIIELKQVEDCKGCFEATIQVQTVIESEDPPYANDQITIDVRNGSVTVVDYVHKTE
ncbi:DUF3888 domain-containing protein [Piscibacillus halophilus]|uniref:DUF3888 domain-containing protein n=1 Tax=Piscibacillus halophilus TaxID=571933 RepID=UPI002409E77F|nr:DUF3888 domain-containing protein [Piscibacillus halophilus]